MNWNYFVVRIPTATKLGPRATMVLLERVMAETNALMGARLSFIGCLDTPSCFHPRAVQKVLDEELGNPAR
jgi:hypothetical protein